MKPLAIWRKGEELLDARQQARFRQLNMIERLIVQKLILELKDQLEEKDGRITSRKGHVALGKSVDAVFDAVEQAELQSMGANLVDDMKGVLKFNTDYFKAIDKRKKSEFKAIRSTVDATMRKRLGINSEDGIVRKGYLDKLFRNVAARDEVKDMVAKQVAAGVPMKKLEKALRLKVAGTKNTSGVLEKHIGGFVLDTYNLADSLTNNEFAQRLGLRYFIYSGGLIETSREFCRKRNGKVFSTDEAKDWPNDPTLLKTKAEEEAGGSPADYVPLEDRGRWRCRHRLLYIPEEEAFRRRPELRVAA